MRLSQRSRLEIGRLLVTPEVEVVQYGALPRTDRKSKRVFDTRITDSVI